MSNEVDVCVAGEKFGPIEIISILVTCSGILIIIIIGLTLLKHLANVFKYLFYTSWISSCFC